MVWYSNGGLKTRLKKNVYGLKCQVFDWSAKSRDFTIWIPDTHTGGGMKRLKKASSKISYIWSRVDSFQKKLCLLLNELA